ncbi:hypothetical protein [Segniliparus rugosus]|uniref:Uncharacterized protein n=1 Tax=Segniliparus rugosus (strain ATCC BAA-974 / DSM 45345 / CCUG 50838 / CIP 108380 / JCM 13579 / CDC 945) TaxID=679197 RepID=E5XRE5_SEGRC|nr:hypothetical protein [Segniliparus rugosus]EFV13078.1 hypothetical protein HMPREF9336_02067 [Segniliparus rugosus ATCC BAA-974]
MLTDGAAEPRKPAPLRWLHRITLAACVSGCLLWLYSHSFFRETSFRPWVQGLVLLFLAGALWFVFASVSLFKEYPSRRIYIAPAIAVVALALASAHIPSRLGWRASKPSFEAAAAELRHNPEQAQDFRRRLGVYEVRRAYADKDTGVVYFVLDAGGFFTGDVLAYAPDETPPASGSIRDCLPFDGPWLTCVEYFD